MPEQETVPSSTFVAEAATGGRCRASTSLSAASSSEFAAAASVAGSDHDLEMGKDLVCMSPVMSALHGLPMHPVSSKEVMERLANRLGFCGDKATLLNVLPNSDGIGLPSTSEGDERQLLTHNDIRWFIAMHSIQEYIDLPEPARRAPGVDGLGPGRRARVALAMPQGPEMALALLFTIAHGTAVPVDAAAKAEEMKKDLRKANVDALVMLHGEENASVCDEVAKALGITLLTAIKSNERYGLFVLCKSTDKSSPDTFNEKKQEEKFEKLRPRSILEQEEMMLQRSDFKWTRPSDTAIVFFTSGTSGDKKVVPYTLEQLVAGSSCVCHSWQLKPEDVCINMMPLCHVGGVSRSLLAPLLGGGGTLVFKGMDAGNFWDTIERPQGLPPSWYYASPTMHKMFLDEGSARAAERSDGSPPPSNLRFIANAAGALGDEIAKSMKRTFGCAIYPSYGMTECMPITAPPLNYQLDRANSSGRPCGPEVAIFNVPTDVEEEHEPPAPRNMLPTGVVGEICIRGSIVFNGYEGGEEATDKSFIPDGGSPWFMTGDLGKLDVDNYLYITGRRKEVINRGGEIIAPIEVEDALRQHKDLHDLLAFSQPHDDMQEVVGVAVVVKEGRPRPTLKALQAFANKSLHSSKWPQTVVYMEPGVASGTADLPRGPPPNCKPQRAHFAKRAKLPEIRDSTPEHLCMLQAVAPPPGTAVSHAFGHEVATPRLLTIAQRVEEIGSGAGYGVQSAVALIRSPVGGRRFLVVYVSGVAKGANMAALLKDVQTQADADGTLHGYEIPSDIIPCDQKALDDAKLGDQSGLPDCSVASSAKMTQRKNQVEEKVAAAWRTVLMDHGVMRPGEDIPAGQTWSLLGGKSHMMAHVIKEIKKFSPPKVFGITGLSVGDLHMAKTVEGLSRIVQRLIAEQGQRGAGGRGAGSAEDADKAGAPDATDSGEPKKKGENKDPRKKGSQLSRHPAVILVQALPLLLYAPFRRMLVWSCFVRIWAVYYAMLEPLEEIKDWHFFIRSLFLAIATIRIAGPLVMPFVGILLKWVIIWRYKEGSCPLWSLYYLRWWTTQQLLAIMGRGLFTETPWGMRTYYRLLGAKIGRDVKISPKAKLGEFDLIEIGDGTLIDGKSYVRPFIMDKGFMGLRRIKIGKGCSVGVNSTVLAGATMPDHTNIGPLSSTYEMESTHEDNLKSCRPGFAGPRGWWRLWGEVIVGFVGLCGWFPVLIMLVILANTHFYKERELSGDPRTILEWFSTPERMLFYGAIKAVRAVVCPWCRFAAIVFVKRCMGPFVVGARDTRGGWGSCRHWVMAKLLPDGTMAGVAPLLGRHYEKVSCCYRALGAQVGKRVYWPGSGLEIVEHDLLSVGDDVIFGSRSVAIPCDAEQNKGIVLRNGSFIADRCVLLPGAEVGTNAMLGSGCLAPVDFKARAGSTWVGSRKRHPVLLDEGDKQAQTASTVKPFGRAFYKHDGFQAPYTVLPESVVIFYHHFWFAFAAAYKALALVLSVGLAKLFLGGSYVEGFSFETCAVTIGGIYMLLFFTQNFFSLMICVIAKWLLFGQRKVGNYDWDGSNYCQKWQMLLCIEEIRRRVGYGKRGILDYIMGSEALNCYFRLLGANIGVNCCLYPNNGDPMMTEPDLVHIGHDVCVDDASVVCHINSKGKFDLNHLAIGGKATLRSFSRLLSGATMYPRSKLMEHTLVHPHDEVDAGVTMQGWPQNPESRSWDMEEIAEDTLSFWDFSARRSVQETIEAELSPGGASPSASPTADQPDGQGASRSSSPSTAPGDSPGGPKIDDRAAAGSAACPAARLVAASEGIGHGWKDPGPRSFPVQGIKITSPVSREREHRSVVFEIGPKERGKAPVLLPDDSDAESDAED